MREITPEFAKEFTDEAERLNVLSWDVGKQDVTDQLRVDKAKELLGVLNNIESNKGTINEAALTLMRLGQVEVKTDVTREAYAKLFGEQPNGAAPAPAQAEQPAAAGFGPSPSGQTASPPSTPAEQQIPGTADTFADPAPAGGETDISSIFPGYDDMKVAQIKEAVLASAKSGDLSPEEWEQIKAYEGAHEDRKTVLSLQPEFRAPEPEPQPSAFEQRVEQEGVTVTQRADGATEFRVPTGHAGDGDTVLAAYNDETVSRVQQEGLPTPPSAPAEVAALPLDLTALSDAQVTEFGSLYHSVFAHAQWALSQEEGRAAYAEHLERETEHDEFVRAYALHQQQIPEEKRTQPTALEAARKQAERDAEGHPKVRDWRSKKVRHNVEARKLKAIVTIADKAVWRVDKELDRRARAQTTAHAAR